MGRKAIDYTNSEVFIYQLVHKWRTDIEYNYVGHTFNIIKRRYSHKSSCNNSNDVIYNLKIYQIIRDNGGWDEWEMKIIHRCYVKDKIEARMIEQKFINELNANMNAIKSYTSDEEKKGYNQQYYQKNMEQIKQYYQENNEQIKQYNQQYYQENTEHILERKKKYNKQNNEQIKQYYQQYYQEKKNYFLEKHICSCGSTYRICDKSKHFKTIKHKNYEVSKILSY